MTRLNWITHGKKRKNVSTCNFLKIYLKKKKENGNCMRWNHTVSGAHVLDLNLEPIPNPIGQTTESLSYVKSIWDGQQLAQNLTFIFLFLVCHTMQFANCNRLHISFCPIRTRTRFYAFFSRNPINNINHGFSFFSQSNFFISIKKVSIFKFLWSQEKLLTKRANFSSWIDFLQPNKSNL